jgi:hypothetical protein
VDLCRVSNQSPRLGLISGLALVTVAIALAVTPGCTASVEGSQDSATTPPDGSSGIELSTTRPDLGAPDARTDQGSAPSPDTGKPDPCSPLPAGCLCAAACDSAGNCDNSKCPCQAIPGVSYGSLPTSETSSQDPATHVDVNLLMRKVKAVNKTLGLVSINGPTDTAPPPLLHTIFVDERVPSFPAVYQVEKWDWGCNCFTGYLSSPEVTLAGMGTSAGEVLRVPHSGYNIGQGKTALVLYAAPNTITLKYTVEDNVVKGYTVHISGICIEPSLQALYTSLHAAGRKQLPALSSRQPFGRAIGSEIRVSIRDTGSWMDPRSKKDWWQGK